MEASWKKPVGRFREVIQAPKKVSFCSAVIIEYCSKLCPYYALVEILINCINVLVPAAFDTNLDIVANF